MSAQAVKLVSPGEMSDTTFADMLFANPDAALAGFDLTAEETAKIKSISRAEFENALPGQEDPTAKN